MPYSKYGNKKTEIDGYLFDSKKEAKRYAELKLLDRGGEIRKLVLQPKFLLQKGFEDFMGNKHKPIFYIADFCYEDKQKKWVMVVEDVKGMKTDVYRLKKKLLLYKYTNLLFNEI